MTYVRFAVAAAIAAAASLAGAQTPPAAPAADTAQCSKPDPHPGRLASAEKMRGWNKEVQGWQECMKKYIADLQVKADAAVKSANSAVADSNNAIAAYNATVKDLQAQADAAK